MRPPLLKEGSMIKRLSSFLALCAFAFGAAHAASYNAENIMRDYPLEEVENVITTNRSTFDVFVESIEFILDSYVNSEAKLSKVSKGQGKNTVAAVIEFSNEYKKGMTGIGTLQFKVVLEFKEGRMRWSTQDVALLWDEPTGKTKGKVAMVSTDKTTYGGQRTFGALEEFRRLGSDVYHDHLTRFTKGIEAVAKGSFTAGSDDW